MEFSFDKQSDNNQASAGSASSERLRKAIERNRAKQAKRAPASRTSSGGSVPTQSWSAPGESLSNASTARRNTGRTASSTRTTGSASRRSVASADNVEFTTALRKGVSKPPANVSYSKPAKKTATSVATKYKSSASSRRKKTVTVKPNEYLVRGIWVFCALLLLRLVFSNGGITDYYDKKEVLTLKEQALERLKVENKNLVNEIEKIKTDSSYQKKIVRHHLGHIAKDEYLVLFSN